MFCLRGIGCVLFVLAGCSLVVGEIPEALPGDAGAGTGNLPSGGTGSGGGGRAGNSSSPNNPGGAAQGGMSEDAGDPTDAADGAVSGGAGDGGADPCDRDGDGEESLDCGGDDCDDDDRNVFSTQDRYFDEANPNVIFDYNCDGATERQYPEPLNCNMDLSLCDESEQGYLNYPLPLCGDLGEWGHCMAMEVGGFPTTCVRSQPDEMRRVACR